MCSLQSVEWNHGSDGMEQWNEIFREFESLIFSYLNSWLSEYPRCLHNWGCTVLCMCLMAFRALAGFSHKPIPRMHTLYINTNNTHYTNTNDTFYTNTNTNNTYSLHQYQWHILSIQIPMTYSLYRYQWLILSIPIAMICTLYTDTNDTYSLYRYQWHILSTPIAMMRTLYPDTNDTYSLYQ